MVCQLSMFFVLSEETSSMQKGASYHVPENVSSRGAYGPENSCPHWGRGPESSRPHGEPPVQESTPKLSKETADNTEKQVTLLLRFDHIT